MEFEFEMKSDSDSDRLRPGCHRSDTTVNSALFISLKVSPLFPRRSGSLGSGSYAVDVETRELWRLGAHRQ